MSKNDDDGTGKPNPDNAVRLLSDPETAKFLAAQQGITIDEAEARLREIVEAIKRQKKT